MTAHSYLDAPPLAFAHRGGAAEGDENTAEAFARAIAAGYRYVETDVHATRDGVAVVLHDETLPEQYTGVMTGTKAAVGDLSFKDLSAIRVGGAAVIPRLDEVLVAWPQVRFNVDVKSDAAVAPTATAVVGARERVLLASFSDGRLRRLRELAPGFATSMGQGEVAKLWLASRVGRRLTLPSSVVAAQVPVRHGPIKVVDKRFLRYAHRLGLQVHVWTIDDPAVMVGLLDLGVDGIMTDRIEVLREVYITRGIWKEAR